VKEYFSKRHPKVVYLNDVGEEASQFGESKNIYYAVIDMWLLAHCRYAVYSYSSTFGHVSRALAVQPQIMFQTLSPTLADLKTPLIDGIGKYPYRVLGTCSRIYNKEGCSGAFARWKSRNLTDAFYRVVGQRCSNYIEFPRSFDHGNHC